MPPCPLCGSTENSIFAVLPGLTFRRCTKCDLVHLDAVESPESTHIDYDAGYIERRGHDKTRSAIATAKEATAAHYLKVAERYVEKGKLLEIGCSTGIALKAAAGRGWTATGVDPNEAAVAIARESMGTEAVRLGVLEDGMFPDGTFNAILMLDSIEHIPDPHAMAFVAKKILAPRGVLVLVTPDSASMSAGLLRSRWMHLFADHVNIYSPRSTRYLFEHHGFEILRIGWAPKFVTIDMLASHLACHPDIAAAGPLSFLARLMAPVKDAVFPFNVGELYAVVRKPA